MKIPFAKIQWTRTRLIQITAAAFLVGLLLARYGWGTNAYLLLASVFCCAAIFRYRWLGVIVLSLLALNLGLWRGQTVFASFQTLFNRFDDKLTVVGEVQDDPGIGNRFQTEFHLTKLRLVADDGTQQPVSGRLQVRGFSENAKINRSDVVVAEGKLRPALGNNQGQISFAQITVIGQRRSPLESLRRGFFSGMYTALPEPEASLGLGFLVGLRSLLPDQLLDQLAKTGLTHIVAVSGYNLTILVRFTRRLFIKNSKYLATAGSAFLILGFLAVTGLSPSIFRAAIVSGLALAAWYYGRPLKPLLLILVAAAITAAINPSYLWYDLGWYLSFLAFFGVLVLAPLISRRTYQDRRPPAIAQLVVETLSAQLMVLPLIAFVFGQVSLVSLPANLIILPLIPFAMLLSFVAGTAGMLIGSIAGWLAWPAATMLGLIVRVVEWLSAWPYASTQLRLSGWQLLAFYCVILAISLTIRRGLRARGKPLSAVSLVD